MFQIWAWGFHIGKSRIAVMQSGILSFNKQRFGEQTDVLVIITLFLKSQWQWMPSKDNMTPHKLTESQMCAEDLVATNSWPLLPSLSLFLSQVNLTNNFPSTREKVLLEEHSYRWQGFSRDYGNKVHTIMYLFPLVFLTYIL